jgi:branched-chain amino acid transport system substrate-binding protein
MDYFRSTLGVLWGILILVFSASSNASNNHLQKTINIGIYAPFTNESAHIGRNILGAMELAREQLKSSEINYAFYTLDTHLDDKKAAGILEKFIKLRHIHVLLTEGDDSDTLAAPLARKNNLIHFCLGCTGNTADGQNNFQVYSPSYQRGAILASVINNKFISQFKKEYFSHPIAEAGYAYDVFNLLNQSVMNSMNSSSHCSSQSVVSNLLALASGQGLMGAFSLGKKGIFYKKETLTG